MNDIETLAQKKRRLFGGKYLPKYLEELSRLLGRKVESTELLSIVETDKFIDSINYFKESKPDYKETIKFSDKARLKTILYKTVIGWDVPYMIYLAYSRNCGLMRISSLCCFNWNFDFNDEHGRYITFTRADGKERIVLDYDEEFSEQVLEIRIYKKKN